MKRVRITGTPGAVPKYREGSSNNSGFNAHTFPWPGKGVLVKPEEGVETNKTLGPVDREDANLEAEKGETVVTDMNHDGIPEHYTIGGKRHYDGGTPLNLPKDSFIFSRDNKMKVKDEAILKDFGAGKKPTTPADLAKKYDINKYREVLADKNSDELQKKTAEAMIANYNMKLGKLALVQESTKGFPNGIPHISMPYVTSTQIDPTQFFGTQGQAQTPDANQQAKYGGQYHFGPGGGFEDDGIEPWYSKTTQGKTSPTGRTSDSPFTTEDYNRFYKEKGIDPEKLSPKQAQQALYKRADPYHKALMWGLYGDTAAGGTKSKFEKFKPLASENYTQYKERMSKEYPADKLNNELDKFAPSFADGKNGARVAFLFNEPAPETSAPVADKVVEKAPAIEPTTPTINHMDLVDQVQPKDKWWLQDIVKTAGAASDFARIKKYMPWQATPGVTLPDPTFYDPNRELAANAEQMNIGTQDAQIFTGPQAYNSRFASMQGQGAKNAADIMGRYNNLNVGVANQFSNERAQIMNQVSNNQASSATQLYDKNTIVNQQFDNAKNMARQNLRQNYIDAITNKNETASLNSLFPQFNMSPEIGGKVQYTGKGKPLNPTQQHPDQIVTRAQQYMSMHPGLDWKQAIDLAKTEITGHSYNPDQEALDQYKQMMSMQNHGQ